MSLSSLLFFPIYFGSTSIISRFSKASKLSDKLRVKLEKYLHKWGYVGLAVFVGMPGTSLVGSSFVAAGLKLPIWKSYCAILGGCCIEAGIVVGICKGIGF
jgi:uncharacterized membrane protein